MLEPEGELRAGNAILNVAFTAGAALGPVVAGGVVAGLRHPVGPAARRRLLLRDRLDRVHRRGRCPTRSPSPAGLREQVRAGVGYIRGHTILAAADRAPRPRSLVFFTAVVPIEVVYAKETLGASDTGYGLLLASWGVGMVVGSVVFATLRRASLPVLLFFSTIGDRRRLPGHGRGARPLPSPAPPRRSAAPATASSGWP